MVTRHGCNIYQHTNFEFHSAMTHFPSLMLMLMLMMVAEEAKEFHLGEFRAGMGALPSSDPYK